MKIYLFIVALAVVVIGAASAVYFYSASKAPFAMPAPSNLVGLPIFSPAGTATSSAASQSVAPSAKAAMPSPVRTAIPAPASQAACVGAGQRASGPLSPSDCCPGLRRVFAGFYEAENSCEENGREAKARGLLHYICAACPNQQCESWENWCNCPSDCHFI